MAATLAAHQHGKSRVRLGRVWKDGSTHYFVEWMVDIMLESDMAHAVLVGTNTDMTTTDTQKNTVLTLFEHFSPASHTAFGNDTYGNVTKDSARMQRSRPLEVHRTSSAHVGWPLIECHPDARMLEL